jgi:hypothetical protein
LVVFSADGGYSQQMNAAFQYKLKRRVFLSPLKLEGKGIDTQKP